MWISWSSALSAYLHDALIPNSVPPRQRLGHTFIPILLRFSGDLAREIYRWYDRLQTGGLEALEDRYQGTRVWNRIHDVIRERIVQLALDEPELSPRELATRFTDTANYFVSEASVYRLLKARHPSTSPAYIVMKAPAEFKDKTTAPNQLWQTDW